MKFTIIYFFQILLIFLCLVRSMVAVSPQNILQMSVKYELNWLNPKKGQFGVNLTVSIPQETVNSKWQLKLKYQQPTTKIAVYWDVYDEDAWVILYNKNSYIIQPNNSSRLVRSCLFNALFSSPKNNLNNDTIKGYILPESYILSVNNSADIPLILDSDVQVAWTSYLPEPSGSFVRPYPLTSAADDSDPTPDGMTIIGTPIGLYMYSSVFFIGAVSYFLGTFQRIRFRSQFRYQTNLRDEIKMVPMS